MFSRRGLRKALRHRVLVHTKDGVTTEGVLIGVYHDALAIGHGREHVANGDPVPLDGDRLVPMENVSTVDCVPAPSGAVV